MLDWTLLYTSISAVIIYLIISNIIILTIKYCNVRIDFYSSQTENFSFHFVFLRNEQSINTYYSNIVRILRLKNNFKIEKSVFFPSNFFLTELVFVTKFNFISFDYFYIFVLFTWTVSNLHELENRLREK